MKLKLFCFLSIVIIFSGCDVIDQQISKVYNKPTGTIIAEIDKEYVTLEELNAEIDIYNSSPVVAENADLRIESKEKKISYLEEVVNRKLLYREAIDRGLDLDADYRNAVDNFKTTLLVTRLISDETKDIEVDSAEIEATYNQVKDMLKEPDQRWVREISVSTRSKANEILSQLLTGSSFASMAIQYSTLDSASKGGDLGYVTVGSKGSDFPEFDNVVFASTLEVGALSSVFKGPGGYYIVKLEDEKDGKTPVLTEVWDRIKLALQQEKQQQALDKLLSDVKASTEVKTYKHLIK
ncbi:MAG: peptidylprolyl isomerase [Candidatus Gygaella obscura]|nr:peptidylprolyl isomerase [Candidatus Gygaella obscura]